MWCFGDALQLQWSCSATTEFVQCLAAFNPICFVFCCLQLFFVPSRKAAVPICKVLISPGREPNSRPTSTEADDLPVVMGCDLIRCIQQVCERFRPRRQLWGEQKVPVKCGKMQHQHKITLFAITVVEKKNGSCQGPLTPNPSTSCSLRLQNSYFG